MGSMVFRWFSGKITIGKDGFRWLCTIGPTMEWLCTIVEVYNGALEKKHYHPIVTKKLPSLKSRLDEASYPVIIEHTSHASPHTPELQNITDRVLMLNKMVQNS